MFCKRGWSIDFMAANFPVSFRNTQLRKHRRKVLVEREKALLPAMQVYVEYKKEAAKYRALSEDLRAKYGTYRRHPMNTAEREAQQNTILGRYYVVHEVRIRAFNTLREYDIAVKTLRDELQKYDDGSVEERVVLDKIREAKKRRFDANKIYETAHAAWVVMQGEHTAAAAALNEATNNYVNFQQLYDGAAAPKQKREFIMKCADENCRGFLSTSYKCGTCDKWTCPECLVVIGLEKDATHVCNPDTVETAKAIKADTRGCPKCATRIFKIDGCDQMWCVMEGCGTAFSWTTGAIATGKVHNPHYYEWLRRNGGGAATREVGDIPCGGLPTFRELLMAFMPNGDGDITPSQEEFIDIHRYLSELIDMRLANFPSRQEQLANKELDVEYLMNKISVEEWQRQLEFAEAKFTRKREIGQILQTLATAGSDIMRQLVAQAEILPRELYRPWVDESLQDMEKLRVFGNESLEALSKRDRMAVPQFGKKWKWTPIRALYKAKGAMDEEPQEEPKDMAA